MKYNNYLQNTPKVSEIGLGAWQLGVQSGWKSLSEQEAIEMVQQSLDYGINFFDTAPNYGLGTGEERLGKGLRGIDRDSIVINTKFGHRADGNINYDASLIRESLEGSLRRLGVDYVDSIILHNPPMSYLDGNTNDHYEIFEKLQDEGKIKGYGASLDTFDEMKLLMETTNANVIEAFFNILHQDSARAFPMALKENVSIIAKIPLDSGWLTGKYDAHSTFDDIRNRWSSDDIKTRARLVERVKEILGQPDNLAQKAITFCTHYDAVSTVIPGSVSSSQLKSNVESINQRLSPDQIAELETFYEDEVRALDLPW